jgi:hypothetical protein
VRLPGAQEAFARVTTAWVAGAKDLGPEVAAALRTWLADQLAR